MLQEKNSKAVKSRFASPARAVKVCIGVIAWSEPVIALWFCGHFLLPGKTGAQWKKD